MAPHQADSDGVARMLAAKAGVDWERLGDYPGYSKYVWREQAQAIKAALTDDIALPEGVDEPCLGRCRSLPVRR